MFIFELEPSLWYLYTWQSGPTLSPNNSEHVWALAKIFKPELDSYYKSFRLRAFNHQNLIIHDLMQSDVDVPPWKFSIQDHFWLQVFFAELFANFDPVQTKFAKNWFWRWPSFDSFVPFKYSADFALLLALLHCCFHDLKSLTECIRSLIEWIRSFC